MAAVRCELRPDEELRMMSDTKAPSTERFSLDWKSSCSISLIGLWLCESYVGQWAVESCGMTDFAAKGENSSCTILFSSSLD
jgi:hypothetical protein